MADLHLPWKIEGAPGEYWVSLVRADGYLVAQPIRRHEAAAILKWQQAFLAAEAVKTDTSAAKQGAMSE